jgi:hypothetical protein
MVAEPGVIFIWFLLLLHCLACTNTFDIILKITVGHPHCFIPSKKIHNVLEVCMLSKAMPPLGTFVTYSYTLELVLLLHIEDWAFSKKSVYIFINITFLLFKPKTQKILLSY